MLSALSASGAEETVPAQEILAKVAAHEPVYYDGVLISGNLDLSALPAAQVQEHLALVNCTIPKASFSGVTFAQDALFWGTSFGNVSIGKATFSGQADLSNFGFRPAKSGAGPRSLIFWHGSPAATGCVPATPWPGRFSPSSASAWSSGWVTASAAPPGP